MFCLVYVSSATAHYSVAELTSLLKECVTFNAAHHITGMLLYKDGNFMQVLEGEESEVQQLYAKIKADPRHDGVITLLELQKEARDFPDWAMGFRYLSSTRPLNIPEYNGMLNYPFTGQEFLSNPSECQKLLLSFKKNM